MGIQWTPSFAVGDPTIDSQHQELFSRINRLLSACAEGKGDQVVNDTVKFLEEYVVVHFQTEEKMMREKNYPSYVQHKLIHDQFISRLKDLKVKVAAEKNKLNVVIEVNRVVVDWLTNHILKVDQEFGKFLSTR